jgi:hypothetical protein
MKKLSLYIFLALMVCNLANTLKAEEIEAFCLIKRLDLKQAKLSPDDYYRFVGKEIKFVISFEDNQIYDVSEHGEVSVITGMYGPLDAQKFEKTSNGIKYKHEIKLKGEKEGEFVKYNYNNSITIVDSKPKSLYAIVDQSGLSFNNWNFRINCRNFKYTEKEKQYAKKKQLQIGNQIVKNTEGMPDWFVPLVNRITKDKELKKKLLKEKGKKVKEKENLVIDTDFNPSLIENLYEVNIDGMKKLNGEEIKILLENKRIDTFYVDYEGEHYSADETHGVNGDFYEKSKIHGEATGKWKVQADELCYKYDKYGTVGKYKEMEADKEFICGVYIYSYYKNYYFYNIIDAFVYGKIVSKI